MKIYALLCIVVLTINKPVFEGAQFITGSAQPGSEIHLIIAGESETQTTVADSNGRYAFHLDPLEPHAMITVWSDSGADFVTVKRVACRVFLPMIAGVQ